MVYQGKIGVVFGAGRSGLAAMRALLARGASVRLTDKRPASALAVAAAEAEALDVKVFWGGHPAELLDQADFVVLSPGVPGDLPILSAARKAGIVVLSEIELAFNLAPRRWVAVTGTNGKTTTTSLIAAMFERAAFPYLCGGNIGRALADEVDRLDPRGTVVAEVSSFQLEEIHSFKPAVALITNLTPDHLDRYKTMQAYVAAKARIFENQDNKDFLILNAEDGPLLELAEGARSRKLFFSRLRPVKQGAWIEKGQIMIRVEDLALPLMPLEDLKLRGPHNQENALAASLAAAAAGLPFEAIARTLREFSPVEHRLEECGSLDGIGFINDSKATNVDSVEKALQSFKEPVHLILGGRDKAGDFTRLASLVRERVAEILLIGEAADVIERQLHGLVPTRRVSNMQEAVNKGFEAAKKGEWVLLSPGCASFDMFDNYEHRGRVFKAAVAELVHSGSRV
ncbi:MAG: UDP-N-acetylmuramoyl-L-alanine--D-glutamate ligase [candidate division FCPU426 bacterium]